MKVLRRLAVAVLVTVLLAALVGRGSYARQYREAPNAGCSWRFPLGTDDLGRDRLARLLEGTRVSLLLAPAAALLSTLLAAAAGGLAGFAGGRVDRVVSRTTDLFLCLPWIFLLLLVRAALPLNVSPWTSVLVSFALLGGLGWPGPARVVRSGVRSLLDSDAFLHARACGCAPARLVVVHLLPNLRPVLLAQFWLAIPVFILSEANLGLLGLGVTEPLPSWGGLLRELENYHLVLAQPWLLTPAVLLVIVVSCFQIVLSSEDWRL